MQSFLSDHVASRKVYNTQFVQEVVQVIERRRPASVDVTSLGLAQEVENNNNPFSQHDSPALRNLRDFLVWFTDFIFYK